MPFLSTSNNPDIRAIATFKHVVFTPLPYRDSVDNLEHFNNNLKFLADAVGPAQK